MTEMTVGILFLLKLLGWKCLLSGFTVFIVTTPLNMLVSKKFTNMQSRLMNIRDQKLSLVTEALQGLRYIKFSAKERQWLKIIGDLRRQELEVQWRLFLLDSALFTFWMLGPVMLSAISLAVFSWLYEALPPSTAFTTIAVFSLLEATISVLPDLISHGIEAYVSLLRISEFLKLEEKISISRSADTISFQNATISWPTHTPDPGSFELVKLNFSFPSRELSVVSGETGSGKSLMLAALIGEARLVTGAMSLPEAPSHSEIYHGKMDQSNWILDSALAYVAQNPWIEATTIKENIIFGLPFDQRRYKTVIHSCALDQDLAILPDGDGTSLGVNGVNLSGGQKWRVSFARALYSRAGILILDDIFRFAAPIL